MSFEQRPSCKAPTSVRNEQSVLNWNGCDCDGSMHYAIGFYCCRVTTFWNLIGTANFQAAEVTVWTRRSCQAVSPSSTQESLTYAETNALRFAAGYVCRSVKHLMGSSHPLKEELVLALVDMCGEDKETDHRDASTDWITSIDIDRGGLCHIKDTGYRVFHVMEEELRNSNVRNLSDCCWDKLVSCLVQSEHVASYIRMASLDLEPEEEIVLVWLLVEHWIRIRGFSFTGAYMELYKQKSKKNLQWSKALMTRLAPSSTKS